MSEVIALTVILKVVPIQLLLNYKKYEDAVVAANKIAVALTVKDMVLDPHHTRVVELSDDYGHQVAISVDQVAAVLVTDLAQQNEVQMEIALMTARVQNKVDTTVRREQALSNPLPPQSPYRFTGKDHA